MLMTFSLERRYTSDDYDFYLGAPRDCGDCYGSENDHSRDDPPARFAFDKLSSEAISTCVNA